MTRAGFVVAWCVVLCVGSSEASAQIREDRTRLAINVGAQPQSQTFAEVTTPLIYGESGLLAVPHTIGGSSLLDASVGVRVWERFGIGLGYTRHSEKETSTVSAQIPSPIAFDRLRSATASTGELSHTESIIHTQFLWLMPVSQNLEVTAVLGPSFVTVTQALVSGVNLLEGAPPFSSVTITSAETEKTSKTALALTVGVDLSYLMTARFGAGAFVRYSRTSGGNIDLPSPDGSGEVGVEAGGLQLGAGLRVRF